MSTISPWLAVKGRGPAREGSGASIFSLLGVIALALAAGCAGSPNAAYQPAPGVLLFARGALPLESEFEIEDGPEEGPDLLEAEETPAPQETAEEPDPQKAEEAPAPQETEEKPDPQEPAAPPDEADADEGDTLGDVMQQGVTPAEAPSPAEQKPAGDEAAPEAAPDEVPVVEEGPPPGEMGDLIEDLDQIEAGGEALRRWPDWYRAKGPRFIGLVLDAFSQEQGDADAAFGMTGGSAGFGLRMGWTLLYRGSLTIGLEAAFSQGSQTAAQPAGDVAVQRISAGLRAQGRADEKLQKYLATGLSYHSLDWDGAGYQVDGVGLYFAGGVDYLLTPRVSVGLDARLHLWTGEDDFAAEGNEQSLVVSGGVQLHF